MMAGSTESESTEAQTSEINRLKEIDGKQCKVIKDIGDFSHVVEVKLREADCSVKFQLEGESPILSVADRGFLRGRQPLSLGRKPIIWHGFHRKLHENERN